MRDQRAEEEEIRMKARKYYALLNRVRGVRDELREASQIESNPRQVKKEMAETADDLSQIIKEFDFKGDNDV